MHSNSVSFTTGTDANDSNSEPSRETESSESGSDTSTVSEGDIPISRSCRECPVQVIREHHEEVAEDERIQPVEQERPCPCPHMRNHPPEGQDVGEVEAEESNDMIDGPGLCKVKVAKDVL